MADAITAAEAARPHTGKTVTARLAPGSADIDLGGTRARTLAYNNQLPGPLIRANMGDEIAVTVDNGLDHSTSMHWHGLAVRNDMDGAAPATPDVDPGQASPIGSVRPTRAPTGPTRTPPGHRLRPLPPDHHRRPAEPGRYDAEWIVMLDDWTSGVGSSPDQIFEGLRAMAGATGQSPGTGCLECPEWARCRAWAAWATWATCPGWAEWARCPACPAWAVRRPATCSAATGRRQLPLLPRQWPHPSAATTFTAKPGQRIRIRIINAGADTAFRVALAGHRMTVTHTDGFPVVPTEVDALLLGMGSATTSSSPPATEFFP